MSWKVSMAPVGSTSGAVKLGVAVVAPDRTIAGPPVRAQLKVSGVP